MTHAALLVMLLAVPAAQSSAPPVTASPPPAASTAPAAPIPVLPVDARRLVDEYVQHLLLQLQNLQESYAANQRPDDAAAVKAQIKLLQKAAGLGEDNMPAPERGVPVAMATYRDRVGETFVFTVTGSADKPVWGTNVYTDDSTLEGAAVHAGVLRSGQTAQVRVTVLPGQPRYVGSRKNGVISNDFGLFAGSFRIESGAGPSSRPTSITSFRGRVGETVTLPIVGSLSGTVWGSDIYTDDSSLGAAAVHAGILQPGEFGFVRVTMLPGQASYPAVTRNGVTGQSYGEFQGSMQIARAPQPWAIRLPDDVDGSGMVQLPQLRKYLGVSFSVQVVGATGLVRGSSAYTDDTSIAAAAVHAGILRVGEKGWVRVTIIPGLDSYSGSEQNGIRSANAGTWGGSFQLAPGSRGGDDH